MKQILKTSKILNFIIQRMMEQIEGEFIPRNHVQKNTLYKADEQNLKNVKFIYTEYIIHASFNFLDLRLFEREFRKYQIQNINQLKSIIQEYRICEKADTIIRFSKDIETINDIGIIKKIYRCEVYDDGDVSIKIDSDNSDYKHDAQMYHYTDFTSYAKKINNICISLKSHKGKRTAKKKLADYINEKDIYIIKKSLSDAGIINKFNQISDLKYSKQTHAYILCLVLKENGYLNDLIPNSHYPFFREIISDLPKTNKSYRAENFNIDNNTIKLYNAYLQAVPKKS